ncbi:DUF6381 family protein [Streptomyces sp. NPDC020681]|uniref:DUF6381 family protein n=1 Tax=Streptomyces sp. NPDC020681 TaxID=3365083 RepID=UPI0037BAB67E
MGVADESGSSVRRLRREADELQQKAEQVNDPEERKRLQDKARRLRDRSEQESAMRAGDIYPQE